jgi:hypothetical protein
MLSFYSLAAQKTDIHEKPLGPHGHFDAWFVIRVPWMGTGYRP